MTPRKDANSTASPPRKSCRCSSWLLGLFFGFLLLGLQLFNRWARRQISAGQTGIIGGEPIGAKERGSAGGALGAARAHAAARALGAEKAGAARREPSGAHVFELLPLLLREQFVKPAVGFLLQLVD